MLITENKELKPIRPLTRFAFLSIVAIQSRLPLTTERSLKARPSRLPSFPSLRASCMPAGMLCARAREAGGRHKLPAMFPLRAGRDGRQEKGCKGSRAPPLGADAASLFPLRCHQSSGWRIKASAFALSLPYQGTDGTSRAPARLAFSIRPFLLFMSLGLTHIIADPPAHASVI